MRKLLLWFFVLTCVGLWAWYLLDLQSKKREHGQLRLCITEDVRAVLVVYRPDALLSMMRESTVYRAMQDTSGWGRAIELLANYGLQRDEAIPTDAAYPPLALLFYENGTAQAAMDVFYLKSTPENTTHGCALTAPATGVQLNDPLLDKAWTSTGGKFGTLITRYTPSVLTDEMAGPPGWASLELDISDERWHLFGYVFHEPWPLARPDSSLFAPSSTSFGKKGNTYTFGHYPDFLGLLAKNASPDWTLRRNTLEDSCQCALRDIFSGWHTGRLQYWTAGDEAVLSFELQNMEASERPEALFGKPDETAATFTQAPWPEAPAVAFGLSGRFPIIQQEKGMVSFATSERALSLFRKADARTEHRGSIRNANALRVIQKSNPLLAPAAEELTTTAALRFESESQTYVQITIGMGSSAAPGKDNMLWLSMLTSSPATPLFTVTNHNNREKEIFFQDTEGKVHLISSGGQILWSKPVDGTLMGNVTQIDLLNNGKLQLAFNTTNTLYVLDRNGNVTEGFPVKLAGMASGPVGVFDYDQNKDYRFIVPLADGSMVNVNSKGQPVKGWQYKKAATPIIRIEHWQLGKNDYLLGLAADGEIKVMQRNGTPKWTPAGRAEGLGKNYFLRKDKSIEDSYIIYQANDSLLRMATFGQKGADDIPTPGIQWAKWFYGPVNSDSQADMMLISDNLCTLLLNGSENEILIPLDELPSALPLIVQRPEGDNYILFDQPKAGHILAFRLNGEPVPGFPLEGYAPFAAADLNLSGRLNLVVTGDGELVCFSLEN